jgi:hypothetical protein
MDALSASGKSDMDIDYEYMSFTVFLVRRGRTTAKSDIDGEMKMG